MKKKHSHLSRKSLVVCGLFLLGVLWQAGCVDISDTKVQVQAPGQVDTYDRSFITQCTPHVMPHRLIRATIGEASPYFHTSGALVSDQADFDLWWSALTVQLDQNKVVTDNLKPVIDWTNQIANIVVVPLTGPCQKTKPFGDEMTTDCYNVTIPIYIWNEGQDCSSDVPSYPVYIYIYPIVNLPVNVQWVQPTPTLTLVPSPTPTSTPSPTPSPTPTPDDDQ
jgi:hypothetical protein